MSVNLTAQHIRAAAKAKPNESNMQSVLVALDRYGDMFGLDQIHRTVMFVAELMHESGDFRFDQEIWGPTPAQKRYDTRADLGNTPAADGDGKLYLGRSGIQITGKANYLDFEDWCNEQGLNPPDFIKHPEKVNTDPWEGLAPIWFWSSHNLNRWADQGDIETVSTKINGGKNGLADRIDRWVRLALVVLGLPVGGLKQFQKAKGLEPDGDPGPKTRAALHLALLDLSGASTKLAAYAAAPVVEEKTVVPVEVEKSVKKRFNLLGWIGGTFSTGGGFGLAALAGFDWRALIVIIASIAILFLLGLALRHWLIAGIKDIRQALES